MWRSDRRACATVALMVLAGIAGIASVAQAEERHEHRSAAPARHADSRPGHRSYAVRPAAANQHPALNYHREMVGRSIQERRLADGRVMRETRLAGGARVQEISHAGSQVHVVRYGNAVSGTVERTIRPGLMSRTFVSGGHVMYTRVYQQHVWHQFGRAFAYETFVPAVRYPAAYYGWALGAWPRPVYYSWGWHAQAWYPTYGVLFTPYPVYTSPDLWMTDYIIAQNMQRAYQAQTVAPVGEPSPAGAPAEAVQYADPAAAPAPAAPVQYVDPAAAPAPAAPVQYVDPAAAPAPNQTEAAPPGTQSSEPVPPTAPTAAPPAVTPEVKAQLNAQIKVRLQEQQSAAASPATQTNLSTPPALRPNHVFFEVVQPLDVPSGTANHFCSLGANDYIKRTGGMSQDDWTIPVVVELSGPSDCPKGLKTRVGLNDLNAMENEQQAEVMEAMQAASKSMGPNGPPKGGAHPTLIADGRAAPAPGALDEIRQAQ
jgi:hypothetical protein